MCIHQHTIQLKRDGTTKQICDIRGTCYCTLSVLEYPEFAIVNPEACKDFEKEKKAI